MKRLLAMFAALAALWVQPANATVSVQFSIDATLPVTHTIDYGPLTFLWPSECAGLQICELTKVITETIHTDFALGSSTDGINFGFNANLTQPGLSASLGGTAIYLGNGVYQGTSLSYSSANRGGPEWPMDFGQGTTTSFSIRQNFPVPVPEPATWALMLVGFSLIGSAIRQQRRQTHLKQYRGCCPRSRCQPV